MKQTFEFVPSAHRTSDVLQSAQRNPSQFSEPCGTISALQRTLEAVAHHLEKLGERQEPLVAEKASNEYLLLTAISRRQRRKTMFPAELFADPAWDMLLELYRAELRQYRISVSNLCDASHGPATTALRWIAHLQSKGMIAREADPFDGRRYYVRLTEAGSGAMRAYFSASLND